MSALARSLQRLRPAAASSSRAPLLRAYATQVQADVDTLFAGPPPPKAKNEVVMKRYTGKGFPNIPGLRHVVHPHHPHLHPSSPLRALTLPLRRAGGRNASGRVVNRGVGGGHKQRLRIVDFHRLEDGVHDVVRIEYDPGRSAHIALIHRRGAGAAAAAVAVDEGARLAELESDERGGTTEKRIRRNEVKGGWSYILAPEGLRAGDVVRSYRSGIPTGLVEGWVSPSSSPSSVSASSPAGDVEGAGVDPAASTSTRALGLLRTLTLKPGNVLPLSLIPPGTSVHALSLTPGGRMQLCRAAGTFAQVVAHHGPRGEALGGADVLHMGGGLGPGGRERKRGSVLVKLQSGEVRRLEPGCVAAVGVVSNKEHQQRQIGKAGRSRWLGKRPKVRGVAMNACDHPHGGGRGKSKGNKHPRSAQGVLKGVRTRRPKDKDGNKQVVSQRPRGKARN
ncbi:mitochondrial 54S ribosomal protein rml2 [Cryptotrichosporon argae]